MKKNSIEPGQRFGSLTVIGDEKRVSNDGVHILCRCDCGASYWAARRKILGGKVLSCGCKQFSGFAVNYAIQHGHCLENRHGSPEYRAWLKAKSRCFNPKDKSYPYYGGRGITMCALWRDNFEAFLAELGPKPNGLTLERKDVNGDYEPGNCKWATRKQQSRNARSNVAVSLGDHKFGSIGELAEELNLDYDMLYRLIRVRNLEASVAVKICRQKDEDDDA